MYKYSEMHYSSYIHLNTPQFVNIHIFLVTEIKQKYIWQGVSMYLSGDLKKSYILVLILEKCFLINQCGVPNIQEAILW